VYEDRGAYGDFGAVATNRSFTLWLSMNRWWVRLVALLVILTAVTIFFLKE
jgi:hypothetical protein